MNGDDAYRMVRTYSAIGIHRTGLPGDGETNRWLARELSDRGADVSLQTYRYHRFGAEVSFRISGRLIESMPLYYSHTGRHEIVKPAIGSIDAHADEADISSDLVNQVAQARARGHDGLVLATMCPTGALCAINREQHSSLGFPVILVAGNEYTNVREGEVIVRFSATVQPDESSNLLARFPGPTDARPVVVTTPVSGWFSCAGERGCGLAVATHVAMLLSEDFPVRLLLTTGHELGFLGGYHLAKNFSERPACIVHIGSCIANHGAELVAVCSAERGTTDRISAALGPLGVQPTVPSNPTWAGDWVGESKCWAFFDRPMLSIAGQAPPFHTADDLPETVTSPELLQEAMDAIGAAARALADHVKPGPPEPL